MHCAINSSLFYFSSLSSINLAAVSSIYVGKYYDVLHVNENISDSAQLIISSYFTLLLLPTKIAKNPNWGPTSTPLNV